MPNHSRQHADVLSELRQNPGALGFHLCGACKRNKARQQRLLNEIERLAAAQLPWSARPTDAPSAGCKNDPETGASLVPAGPSQRWAIH